MPTQKALLVKELGKPLVLVDNHDIPKPGPGQVQIKVSVAGLNPHDQRSRDWGLLIADMLPFVLGKDVVGTVAKLGEGAKDLKVGDRVMSLADSATDSSQSGLQEYAVADSVHCAKIPANLSDDEAASLPTNLSSVFIALYITLGLPAPWTKDISNPEKLLVVGGGSNCGRLTVQLAKLAGIPKIVVVGGDEHELKALGATHVIDRHGDEEAVAKRV
ncbi:hypothetical protein LTR37_018525 [Vermiconidia calcicola]|uniref:Uncharacterized protein n=1 Tax=Vermiconidia calcicola TaxID=1690605 RepID=A0ACC3MGW5_9PEZI|nr:hypothetical protein LTR37_018525 [Vermiconidia calcicola]